MAIRPVFAPGNLNFPHVCVTDVEFKWHPGLSLSQKQKSIQSLHESAIARGLCKNPLEISRRSNCELGVNLSAFNLKAGNMAGAVRTVESVFQAAKIFEGGGPYLDLLDVDSKSAKTDLRLKSSGRLIAFTHQGESWPLEPKTAFYDWLYISALLESGFVERLLSYDAFTDIEFNPAKSFNCQAHSVAVFLTLLTSRKLESALNSQSQFLREVKKVYQVS